MRVQFSDTLMYATLKWAANKSEDLNWYSYVLALPFILIVSFFGMIIAMIIDFLVAMGVEI